MSETIAGVALLIAAYFAGSFPTASAVGLLSGHDHSKEGSGNPGASNVYRTSGAAYGIVTVVVDVLKGFIPVLAAVFILNRSWGAAAWAVATVGHVIPFARWRNGGKGVATGGGGSLPLFPYLGLILVPVFVVLVKLTKRASVGSLAITVLAAIGVVIMHEEPVEILAVVVVTGVILYRHKSNIGRLLSGNELKVG